MGRQQVGDTMIHEWDSHDIVVEEDSTHIQIIFIQGGEKQGKLKLCQTRRYFCIGTRDVRQT